jgi:endonuclease/exonuclease/phosphatase family metal-dependent hydrolase
MLRHVILAAALAAGACSGVLQSARAARVGPPACRAGTGSAADVRWVEAESASDRSNLDEWCRTVGPAVVLRPSALTSAAPRLDDVAIVSWNVEVGGGDLDGFLDRIESDRGRAVVVLVQEAYRDGALVPPSASAARTPGRIAPTPPSGDRRSIIETARRRGLSLFYAPSMRNGRDATREAAEDRGNAILSTLPLSDLTAIELPFEHQRRVAVAASVRVIDSAGRESALHLVNAHLDVQASWRRGRLLWFGRVRQTRALLSAIDRLPDPKILGGDFNSWLGDGEPAVREARSRFPQTPSSDAHVTFPLVGPFGLHLDHLFFRLPAGWVASVSRMGERWGSDHYPLVATLNTR